MGRCVGMTTLAILCAEFPETKKPQPLRTPKPAEGLVDIYPHEIFLVFFCVTSSIDTSVIVRTECFHVKEKFKLNQLGSKSRNVDM